MKQVALYIFTADDFRSRLNGIYICNLLLIFYANINLFVSSLEFIMIMSSPIAKLSGDVERWCYANKLAQWL